MIRTLFVFLALIPTAAGVSVAGDWIHAPSDFTHNPYSGQRVVQYAPRPPAYYRYYNDYAVSGYRLTNSTLRVGSSVDRTYFAETWGGGGLAFASAWMWRGFNEDYIYPNDVDRDFRGRHGRHHRDFDHRGPRGWSGSGGGPHGFSSRGFAGGGFYGDSGSVSFDKDGATIGWDTYGGGWASGFSNGFNQPSWRQPRRDDRFEPRR